MIVLDEARGLVPHKFAWQFCFCRNNHQRSRFDLDRLDADYEFPGARTVRVCDRRSEPQRGYQPYDHGNLAMVWFHNACLIVVAAAFHRPQFGHP